MAVLKRLVAMVMRIDGLRPRSRLTGFAIGESSDEGPYDWRITAAVLSLFFSVATGFERAASVPR